MVSKKAVLWPQRTLEDKFGGLLKGCPLASQITRGQVSWLTERLSSDPNAPAAFPESSSAPEASRVTQFV